jgi:hypothetical protein
MACAKMIGITRQHLLLKVKKLRTPPIVCFLQFSLHIESEFAVFLVPIKHKG